MKKYTFLLVVALAIASAPSVATAQDMGLKIANLEGFGGTSFEATTTNLGVSGVIYTSIPSTSISQGNLSFFTFDENLGNKKIVSCDTTIGNLLDKIHIPNSGLLVLSKLVTTTDTFQSRIETTPQLTLISEEGKVVWQKNYENFKIISDKMQNLNQFYKAGKVAESDECFIVAFSGVLFSLDKKTGEVLKSADVPTSYFPVSLSFFQNEMTLVTRKDTFFKGTLVGTLQYDFYCLSEFSNQTIGVVSLQMMEKWHYTTTLPALRKTDYIYEKINVRLLAKDSFEFVIYGNGLNTDVVRKVVISNSGLQKTDIVMPFLKNNFGMRTELKYSNVNQFYYLTSMRYENNQDDQYKYCQILVTKTLTDTLFLLKEAIDGEQFLFLKINEMPDGGFLLSGLSKNPDVYSYLVKVARAPFKPNLTVVWNGTLEWSNPLPTGGAVADAFTVAYKTADDSDWNTIDLGKVNNYTLKNLKSNTLYSIKVRAHNIAGWGEYSDVQTLQTQNTATHNVAVQTLNVYPNPAKSGETLTINALAGATIYISSYSGKQVFEGTLLSNTLTLPDLSRGIYVVSVYTDNKKYQSKLIIQ